MRIMKPIPQNQRFLTVLAASLLAAATVGGLLFGLWVENGPRMFAAMVEAGLALCF